MTEAKQKERETRAKLGPRYTRSEPATTRIIAEPTPWRRRSTGFRTGHPTRDSR